MSEMTRSQQAAAFHGLATNPAIPPHERLSLALQALELYEGEVEQLREVLERVERDNCGCLGYPVDRPEAS